jgi:hypothetical protein
MLRIESIFVLKNIELDPPLLKIFLNFHNTPLKTVLTSAADAKTGVHGRDKNGLPVLPCNPYGNSRAVNGSIFDQRFKRH